MTTDQTTAVSESPARSEVGKGARVAIEKCLQNEAKLTPIRNSIRKTAARNVDGSETPAGADTALVRLQEKTGADTGSALIKLTEAYLRKISRPKRKILEEDVYVQEIESIIERDFFPYMEKMRAQADFADAVDEDDVKKLQSLIAKYGRACLDGTDIGDRSPSTFDTPLARNPSPPRDSSASLISDILSNTGGSMRTVKEREILKADSKKGLNDFMSRVTSEDNVSFDELCTLQNIAQRIKHYWIFKAETEAHSSLAIQDSRNENSNSLELALKDSSIDTGKTKHSVPLDTWPYQARNMLMFNPDGIDVALQDKMADAKKSTMQIVHNNTRFAPGFLEEQQKQAKLTDHIAQTKAMKRGNIGPDGKEIVPDNENDPNAKYSFLATPSPMPGHGADASPAMFWGSVENTPARLADGNSSLPPIRGNTPIFKIPEVPERDRLGLELAEKAAKNHRSKKSKALNEVKSKLAAVSSKSPKFGSIRSGNSAACSRSLASMSPAAQLLLANRIRDRTGSTISNSTSMSMSESLRASYSPKRTKSPASNSTRSIGSTNSRFSSPSINSNTHSPKVRKTTPVPGSLASMVRKGREKTPLSEAVKMKSQESCQSSITDDLLELKNTNQTKRVAASDFF